MYHTYLRGLRIAGERLKNLLQRTVLRLREKTSRKRYVLFGSSPTFLKLIFVVPTVQQYSSKVQCSTAKYATMQHVQQLPVQQFLFFVA